MTDPITNSTLLRVTYYEELIKDCVCLFIKLKNHMDVNSSLVPTYVWLKRKFSEVSLKSARRYIFSLYSYYVDK